MAGLLRARRDSLCPDEPRHGITKTQERRSGDSRRSGGWTHASSTPEGRINAAWSGNDAGPQENPIGDGVVVGMGMRCDDAIDGATRRSGRSLCTRRVSTWKDGVGRRRRRGRLGGLTTKKLEPERTTPMELQSPRNLQKFHLSSPCLPKTSPRPDSSPPWSRVAFSASFPCEGRRRYRKKTPPAQMEEALTTLKR